MSEPSFELQKLVTVATYTFPWEAQVARGRLEAEGIAALIADEHTIRMVALNSALGGIQVRVREADAGAAAEVLRRRTPLPEIYLLNDRELGRGRCPSCAGGELLAERGSRLLLGLLPIPARRFRCRACDATWSEAELRSTAVTGLEPADGAAPAIPLDEPLVTAARFHSVWEAHLARTLLESEGIPACVLEERLPAVSLLSGQPLAANRLEVRGADAVRAAEVLSQAWSAPAGESDAEI